MLIKHITPEAIGHNITVTTKGPLGEFQEQYTGTLTDYTTITGKGESTRTYRYGVETQNVIYVPTTRIKLKFMHGTITVFANATYTINDEAQ